MQLSIIVKIVVSKIQVEIVATVAVVAEVEEVEEAKAEVAAEKVEIIISVHIMMNGKSLA